MELERSDVPVVAADAVRAARIRHKDLLEPPSPSGDRRAAAQASIDPPRFQPELGETVPAAFQLDSVRMYSAHAARVLATSALREELVLPQPVPYGRLAQANPLGDLARGESLVDQGGRCVAIDPSLRSVAIPVNSRQPVPLDPVPRPSRDADQSSGRWPRGKAPASDTTRVSPPPRHEH